MHDIVRRRYILGFVGYCSSCFIHIAFSNMSDSEDEDSSVCPLCVEEMDLSDKNFLPCPCGYRVCMWCWHHIRENLNGLCPACRTPYNSDPHAFSAVDRQEVVKKNRERKQREKQDKKVSDKPPVTPKPSSVDRKHLHNYRVVQRNLVYVIGLPLSSANEDLLRKAEYFGQYGKIVKVVVHRNQSISQSTVSAYVTFAFKEDAKAAIHALDSFSLEGHILRASFGTTKYCNNFIRNMPCNNPECVYLHDLGDEDDRFTKEEIQAGHTKLTPTPGKDQSIVTGCGGPSGTGKRPVGEPILPPPVFLQDNPPPANQQSSKSLHRSSVISQPTIQLVESSKDDDQPPQASQQSSTLAKSSNPIIENHVLKTDVAPHTTQVKKIAGSNMAESKVVEPSNEQPIANIAAPGVVIAENKTSQEQMNRLNVVVLSPESSNAFNGVTWNAVFPVPTSSLSSPIWSAILRVSHSNLLSNPFHQSKLTVSEIMELTLPPVDAGANAPWPKPQSFYASSMVTAEGSKRIEGEGPGPMKGKNVPQISPGAEQSIDQGRSQIPINNSFSALRQLFPGVNLTYGANATFVGNGNR